jgi:hypothetical protein
LARADLREPAPRVTLVLSGPSKRADSIELVVRRWPRCPAEKSWKPSRFSMSCTILAVAFGKAGKASAKVLAAADKPAPEPKNPPRAGAKSLVDRPSGFEGLARVDGKTAERYSWPSRRSSRRGTYTIPPPVITSLSLA